MSNALPLPLSLSPLICVLSSGDLVELLTSSSLPPLQHLLQSFSPLPQVTTRTTTLTSVSHASFHLRFSDLSDTEVACKEDEDSRAGRTIDWIGQRIAKRAAGWVEHVERLDDIEAKSRKTPWWEELQRCTEGDRTPSRMEGWNHPVAVILAVSTLAPNPLQAVTELHSRHINFPPWIDPVMLRHTLIIHPSNSPLNSDEAMALFNATKKQYGLHTHLLSVSLASPPNPIVVPSLLPELPPTPMPDATFSLADPLEISHHLNLIEQDVAQFARFVREFVTMSLVPWMERCVLEWNETYSSTRRLPSRLFSSTRRLFGGSSSSYPSQPSVQSPSSYSSTTTSPTANSFSGPPPQQRRLAEFATFLGDLKLATNVWESLRKEGRNGSEVLPLLLAPSPTLGTHAAHALSILQTPDSGPSAQLRALVYAVRWEAGVRDLTFLGGERWLDWAAGSTEEPPPALLLAQAALISARKGAHRRAALWYTFAANRLEKCGIKPLTVYFLRKAHELFRTKPHKNLSPSFEQAHFRKEIDHFDSILSSIEYSLGRLMYTSGDTEGALRFFLGLLKGSPHHILEQEFRETDSLYIEDFRVAFEHLKSTVGERAFPADLKLPFSFVKANETKVRLARQGELDVDSTRWDGLEHNWTSFWTTRGRERLEKGGKAAVGERTWIDLMLKNPLDVEVTLADLTVKVDIIKGAGNTDVEVIESVVLRPQESRVVPVSMISHQPCSLRVTHLNYVFLSILPVTETLAVRGPRLHQTPTQLQNIAYGPNVNLIVEVEEGGKRLDLSFSGPAENLGRLVLGAGECIDLALNVRNTGRSNIDEIWLIHSPTLWFELENKDNISMSTSARTEVFCSDNSLADTPPVLIPLASLHTSAVLTPDESLNLNFIVHAQDPGNQEVAVLLVFREIGQPNFYSSRIHRTFDAVPILDIRTLARPSAGPEPSYVIDIEIENVNEARDVRISQVSTASANWICSSVDLQALISLSNLPSQQIGRIILKVDQWADSSGSMEARSFTVQQLADVIHGHQVQPSTPPSLDVLFSYISATENSLSVRNEANAKLWEASRRTSAVQLLTEQFHQLSPTDIMSIFPLRHPQTLDIIVFWEIPSERRKGFAMVPGLLLGACHAALDEIIQSSEAAKVKRTMYAETTKEKGEILEAIRASEWNADMDPAVIRVVCEPWVQHDFSKGPCVVPVIFLIRNYSLTNHIRFTLRLQSVDSFRSSEAQHLPPSYAGSLTRRGSLGPLSSTEIKTKMWILRPGIYGLGGWRLETEVGEQPLDPWRTRTAFSQEPMVSEETIVTVLQHTS